MKLRMTAWVLTLVMLLALLPGTAFAASPESIELTVWAADMDQVWLQERLAAFAYANPQWNIT